MRTYKPFTLADNFRLLLRLDKAGKRGNKAAATLARRIGYKYKHKPVQLELELLKMKELTSKALAGNTRAIQKINNLRKAEQKQIIQNHKNKILKNGRKN
jgi:hypothetical protein